MTIDRQPNSLLVELKLPLSEDTLIDELPNIKYLPVWQFLADWNPETGSNDFDKIQGCLQAFQHLHDLQDFQRCEQLLLLALDTPTSHQLMLQTTDRLLHLQIQIWGYNQRAIELYHQILDRLGTSHQHTWLRNLGHCYRKLSQYGKAEQYFDLALELAKTNEDLEEMAMSYCDLISIYGSLGEFDRAIEVGEKGLQIAQRLDLPIERPIRECLGAAYAYRYERDNEITDFNTAQEHFQFALATARDSKDRLAEQAILGNLVNFYLIQQNLDMAIECGLQAINLHQYFDNPLEHSNALGNLGVVYCQKGQNLQAIGDNLNAKEEINRGIEHLLNSLKISVDLNELSNQVWMHCNIAEAYSISERIEKGKEHLDLAKTTIKKINPSDLRLEQRLQSLQEQLKKGETQNSDKIVH